MRFTRAVWAFSFACACAKQDAPTAAAAKAMDAEPADVVQLRFGWPNGTALVTTTFEKSDQRDGVEILGISMELSSRISASNHPDHLALAWVESSVTQQEIRGSMEPLMRAAFQTTIDACTVPFTERVSREGVAIGMDGVEGVVLAIQALVEKPLAELAEAIGNAPELASLSPILDRLRPEAVAEGLTTEFAEDWNAQVAYWIGSDLEIGSDYQVVEQVAHPTLPEGVTYPVTTTFRVVERRPCRTGEARLGCVLIRRTVSHDADSLADITATLLTATFAHMPEAPLIRVDSMSNVTTVEIVTEPSTLRTWQITTTEQTTGNTTVGDQVSSINDTKVSTSTYAWD